MTDTIPTFTRAEIYQNRLKWVEYLQNPERKKATAYLDKMNEERCCLGHACHLDPVVKESWSYNDDIEEMSILLYGIEESDTVATKLTVVSLGLYDNVGTFRLPKDGSYFEVIQLHEENIPAFLQKFLKEVKSPSVGVNSLAEINDLTSITPQEMGQLLKTIITGVGVTPFKPLKDFPVSHQSLIQIVGS